MTTPPTSSDESQASDLNIWDQVLARLRAELDGEEFRRWFSGTSYAGDSGDYVTVWVLTEPTRRQLSVSYQDRIDRTLRALGRSEAHVRFVVSGVSDDEDD
jgi:chromosomal replication initiation ATPase DnaA